MTSLSLTLWIVLGIALQLLLWLGLALRRHWRDYHALGVADAPAAAFAAVPDEQPASGGWSGWRDFRVVEKTLEDAAQSVCSFHLQPVDGLALPEFLPGQFLTFKLILASGEEIVRCYSLSDAPRRDRYRVSIKQVTGGRASNHFHDYVQPGTLLQVRAPAGHFHLDQSMEPVVLVAGGIGITPLLSMLAWSLAAQPGREVWLFLGVRNARELVEPARLAALAAAQPNFRLHYCFSDPLPEEREGVDYQHRGRLSVALMRQLLPLKAWQFYICGPLPMMESVVGDLAAWGVPESSIHYEAFGPASLPRPAAAPAASVPAGQEIVVNFARSGRQAVWQASFGNLQELAEANGVAVDSGCRAGACGSCQTRVSAGEVSYRHPPDFDLPPGYCLLCSALPKTSLTLEA